MKRRISFLLIFLICILVLTTGFMSFAYDTESKVTAYINIEQDNRSTLDVSLCILPHNEMDIAGMAFSISYAFTYGYGEFPFSYAENNQNNNLHLNELFSGASVTNSKLSRGTINYVWDTVAPISVSANEVITLATISLDISEDANDGEYMFNLSCSEFYRSKTDDASDTSELIDVSVETSPGGTSFYLGKKMEVVESSYDIVVSETQEVPYSIYVNKNVDVEQCYIDDESIAKISGIENFEDDSGSFISVVGYKVGTTVLVIKGGYNSCEELTVLINIVEPTPYLVSISKSPFKTSYESGEELDLTGLELRVLYNNNKVAYVTSGYTVDPYDFSTSGDKQIKVWYGNTYVYINVVVHDVDKPDVTPVVLYGDGNDDGLVDTKDLVLLRRYLANYNYDTGLSTVEIGDGGDANGDGVIDTKDLVLIRRYLANYNYDTGSSTIILGPQN